MAGSTPTKWKGWKKSKKVPSEGQVEAAFAISPRSHVRLERKTHT